MSLKYVVGFFDPISGPTTTHYDVYYDTVTNSFSVNVEGPDPQNPCNLANAGYSEGEHIVLSDTCSDNPNTSLLQFYFQSTAPYASVVITPNAPGCPVTPPPGTCDIVIENAIASNETASGANDGTVTITASTTHGAITYSLDGITYTSGNFFGSLSPGNYTAYVKDALGCTASQPFTVQAYLNPVQSFTDDLPTVTVSSGNVSRWNAAFNPIVVTYQRRDFFITGVANAGAGQINVTLNTTLPFFTYRMAIDSGAYFKTALYEVFKKAMAYNIVGGFGVLTFNEPYIGDDTSGFLNINAMKPGYYMETKIQYGLDVIHPQFISATHTPNSANGKTRADLSPFLQTLLSAGDAYNYTDVSYSDTSKAASFQLTFREVWDTGQSAWYSAPDPLYAVFAAYQLGEKYGGNMAQYVPFLTTISPEDKAKFLTDWKSPIRYSGLPFEISFIYSENVIDQALYLELIPDCGSEVDGLLLNSHASYLLNADSSRFVIATRGPAIIPALGLNRLLIPDSFDCCAKNIVANIYYLDIDGITKHYIMQPITIRHECPCDDPYVYLKWVNSKGGWDYYRFGFNQMLNATITNDQAVTKFIQNWANDDTLQDNINKSSAPGLSIGASQVDNDTAYTLQWARKSIRAMMLVSTNPIKWQTVIVKDGDTDIIQTRKKLNDINFKLVLRNDNIQNQ